MFLAKEEKEGGPLYILKTLSNEELGQFSIASVDLYREFLCGLLCCVL